MQAIIWLIVQMFNLLHGHGRVAFRFPKCTTKAVWDLWRDGLSVERIRPLRHLKSFDLSRADGNNMSKARKMLKALTVELTYEHVSALSISDRDNLFQEIIDTCNSSAICTQTNRRIIMTAGELKTLHIWQCMIWLVVWITEWNVVMRSILKQFYSSAKLVQIIAQHIHCIYNI